MPKVDENTIIQFNLKWFISTIGSVILAFGSFYFAIQKPNNDSIKTHMDEKFESERRYQDLRFEKLDEMQLTIDGLKQSVEALNKRNEDLIELRNRNTDTGASFGN